MVKGTASPDDPALTDYWKTRRRKGIRLPIDATRLRLLQAQHGRCTRCGELLLHADHPPQTPAEWEQWLAATRKAITKNAITLRDRTPDQSELRLIHTRCHYRQLGTPSARQGLARAGCMEIVHVGTGSDHDLETESSGSCRRPTTPGCRGSASRGGELVIRFEQHPPAQLY
jgi:hypothetical protein